MYLGYEFYRWGSRPSFISPNHPRPSPPPTPPYPLPPPGQFPPAPITTFLTMTPDYLLLPFTGPESVASQYTAQTYSAFSEYKSP